MLVLLVQLTPTVNSMVQTLKLSCNVTSIKLNASISLFTEKLVIMIMLETQSIMNVKLMKTVQMVGVILDSVFLTIQKELMKKNMPHLPPVRLVPQPQPQQLQQQTDSIL